MKIEFSTESPFVAKDEYGNVCTSDRSFFEAIGELIDAYYAFVKGDVEYEFKEEKHWYTGWDAFASSTSRWEALGIWFLVVQADGAFMEFEISPDMGCDEIQERLEILEESQQEVGAN